MQLQAAFWGAVQMVALQHRSCSIELRFLSDPAERSIAVFILLLSSEPQRIKPGLLSQLGQLLPKDLTWLPLSLDELQRAVEPTRPGLHYWRIARVARRLEFIDLPSYLDEHGYEPGTSTQVGDKRSPFGDYEGTRCIPEEPNEFLKRVANTQYCLPMLAPMAASIIDRRSLFEELQATAPAVVSMVVTPFDVDTLLSDRQVAERLKLFVDLRATSLSNSGFGDAEQLRRVFDRYFLLGNRIGLATIRIATPASVDPMVIAHQVCACLGGTKGFDVHPPNRDVPKLGNLMAKIEAEVPATGDQAGWRQATKAIERSLDQQHIEPPMDERFAPFLVRLPHVYSMEEIAALLHLPFGYEEGLPGLSTRMPVPFFSSSQRFDPVADAGEHRTPPADRMRIGRVSPRSSQAAAADDEGLHWHSVPVNDLCKHALIVGSTGSGKTVTTKFLLRELARLGVPFLVIEPVKTEYYASLRLIPGFNKLKRYRFEGTPEGRKSRDYLKFDPLRLQQGVTVARHASYLKSCFEAAFPLEAWQALLIEHGLREYYISSASLGGCGLNLFSRGGPDTVRIEEGRVYPSFDTFTSFFLDRFLDRQLRGTDVSAAKNQPYDKHFEEQRMAFRRRFENLRLGPLGIAFREADEWTCFQPQELFAPFDYLLTRPCIIELDGIPDGEQKSLAMAFLLTFLYERRQADDLISREAGLDPPAVLNHVLVVEEAHRLLANGGSSRRGELQGLDSKNKAVSLFVDMLAEVRALGQGLIIVEQIPTKLAPEAIKNTNLKIMLRLTSRDDRDFLGEAMSFNEEQKQFVSTLRAERGVAVQYVAFDESVEQPVLLSLPLGRSANIQESGLFDRYFREDNHG